MENLLVNPAALSISSYFTTITSIVSAATTPAAATSFDDRRWQPSGSIEGLVIGTLVGIEVINFIIMLSLFYFKDSLNKSPIIFLFKVSLSNLLASLLYMLLTIISSGAEEWIFEYMDCLQNILCRFHWFTSGIMNMVSLDILAVIYFNHFLTIVNHQLHKRFLKWKTALEFITFLWVLANLRNIALFSDIKFGLFDGSNLMRGCIPHRCDNRDYVIFLNILSGTIISIILAWTFLFTQGIQKQSHEQTFTKNLEVYIRYKVGGSSEWKCSTMQKYNHTNNNCCNEVIQLGSDVSGLLDIRVEHPSFSDIYINVDGFAAARNISNEQREIFPQGNITLDLSNSHRMTTSIYTDISSSAEVSSILSIDMTSSHYSPANDSGLLDSGVQHPSFSDIYINTDVFAAALRLRNISNEQCEILPQDNTTLDLSNSHSMTTCIYTDISSSAEVSCDLSTDMTSSHYSPANDTEQPEHRRIYREKPMRAQSFVRRRRKILVLGDMMSGKSNLISAYCSDKYNGDYIPSIFHCLETDAEVLGERINLVVIEISGRDDFRPLRQRAYHKMDAAIICYPVNNIASLERVRSYWVPELRKYAPKAPFVVVGTKRDIRDQARDRVEEYKQKWRGEGQEIEMAGKHSASAEAAFLNEFVSHYRGKSVSNDVGAAAFYECCSIYRDGTRKVFEGVAKIALQKSRRKRKTSRHVNNMCTIT